MAKKQSVDENSGKDFIQNSDIPKVTVRSHPFDENQNQGLFKSKRTRFESDKETLVDDSKKQKINVSDDLLESNDYVKDNVEHITTFSSQVIDKEEKIKKQESQNSCIIKRSNETFEQIFQNYLKHCAELKELEKEQSIVNQKIDYVISLILENQQIISKSLNEIIKETDYKIESCFKKPYPINKT